MQESSGRKGRYGEDMDLRESRLVSWLSEITAIKCGLYPAVAGRLRVAAMIHDIGKQKIPGSIVNKPGKLDKDEFEVMKTHTTQGAEILASVQGELGTMARTICLYHHEWYDGTGYWGKFACDLPVYVPIVSICDVFVALLSERVYKTAWPPEEVMDYLLKKAGTQFNPALTHVFLNLVRCDEGVKALFTNTITQ